METEKLHHSRICRKSKGRNKKIFQFFLSNPNYSQIAGVLSAYSLTGRNFVSVNENGFGGAKEPFKPYTPQEIEKIKELLLKFYTARDITLKKVGKEKEVTQHPEQSLSKLKFYEKVGKKEKEKREILAIENFVIFSHKFRVFYELLWLQAVADLRL